MKLYDHQTHAIKKIISNKRLLLGLKAGLGKTLVAIQSAIETNSKTLVVVPAYLKRNWSNEIKKFAPNKENLFTIIAYSSLEKLECQDFDMIVLDEAHYVKNMTAIRTKAAHKIIQNIKPKRTLLLSGTPIKGKIPELFSLLKILSYGEEFRFDTTYLRFCSTFCNVHIKYFGGREQRSFEGIKNEELLKKVIAPIYYSVEANEVLDMPEQIRKYINLGLECDSLLQGLNLEENAKSFSTKKRDNAILKAHSTLSYLKNLHEEIDKIVVFSDHPDSLVMMQNYFKDSALITGMVDVDKRDAIINKFNDSNRAIIFCSIGAASTGFNLQTAHHMVFNDYPWTTADLEQAEKRIHRLGQKEKCFYHYLLSGEMDEYILNTLQRKREIIEAVL